jgi:hypothetical protein
VTNVGLDRGEAKCQALGYLHVGQSTCDEGEYLALAVIAGVVPTRR